MSDAPPPPSAPPPPPPPPPPPAALTAPPLLSIPDGQVGYNNPVSGIALRRVKGLSTAIIALTAIAGLGSLIAALLAPAMADSAQEFLDGTISEDSFTSDFGPTAATQLVQVAATAAIGIMTIIWMFRMASNIRAFQRRTFWAPVWAIFGWFLPPFVLYVIPFLMLRELWKMSEPVDPQSSRDNPAIWVWFLVFGVAPAALAALQVGSVVMGGIGSGDTEDLAEQLADNVGLTVASGVFGFASAIAWIVVVRKLTTRHVQLTNEQ